jgi:hypothetical protein
MNISFLPDFILNLDQTRRFTSSCNNILKSPLILLLLIYHKLYIINVVCLYEQIFLYYIYQQCYREVNILKFHFLEQHRYNSSIFHTFPGQRGIFPIYFVLVRALPFKNGGGGSRSWPVCRTS